MARPYIEFVQAQNVAWEDCPDGTAVKRLNGDPESGDETLLLRYPAGHRGSSIETDERAEEFFVLEGSVTDNLERTHDRHAYAFFPRGGGVGIAGSDRGAVVLMFRHGRSDPNSVADTAPEIAIDTPRMPWDVSTYDPKLSHLRLARKVLRLGPNDSGRTFLLAGMPHGVPEETHLPSEHHDHAEEMFMLGGAMWAPEGRMAAGAYFYRPPGIEHGPHVSETGFFQIMRSPGANRIVTHWSQETYPLPIGARHAPVIPDNLPDSWRQPWTEPQGY